MCWERKDLDYVRLKLQEDIRATRERGRVPRSVRVGAWGAIALLLMLADLLPLVVPAIVLFEAFLAPRLARPPARELGPLREWMPPEGIESPEAQPTWAGRRLPG